VSSKSIVLLLALCFSLPALAGAEIAGQASVIDGDTIEVHGQRIRLFGIDAPESRQLCRDAAGKPYRCGAVAANSLSDFIDRRPVSCAQVDRDRYNRVVAVCTVSGVDLADWLVGHGLALDWPRYSEGRYSASQERAKRALEGLWKGDFELPWEWRRSHLQRL
jgi:endonuclease YncB( thermonuclease family)